MRDHLEIETNAFSDARTCLLRKLSCLPEKWRSDPWLGFDEKMKQESEEPDIGDAEVVAPTEVKSEKGTLT